MACTAPLGVAPAKGARKTVTIVFSDLVGSTALGERLDSEALREVLDRYFSEMRACLERHGGIVEKYIGDAIMAVFGLPRAHEDDGVRALRAAVDMKRTLARLNEELEPRWGAHLASRTGVHTGEVVVGDPADRQRLVTGDAVNTAARLEQAAPPGEVLVGESTYRLARAIVEVVPVEPVAAKGKAEPVIAFRLVTVSGGEALDRGIDRPLVGRHRELDALLEAFDRSDGETRCVLASVIGEAGVGKTRLVVEFLRRVGHRARIARGRSISYGEGITWWALSEAIRDAAGISEDGSREVALEKLGALCRGAADAEMIESRVGAAMGLLGATFPKEELFWGFRKLIEHIARERPLVLVLDDIQWAEPTLLEAIVDLASRAANAAILLLCMARPELDEEREGWADEVPARLTLRLESLSDQDSRSVVGMVLGDTRLSTETVDRIIRVSGGNPLFLEQILGLWEDEGLIVRGDRSGELTLDGAELPIPPSIQALLAARLDGLNEQERAVLERGAVIGQIFSLGAVEALSPEELRAKLVPSLVTLEKRRLVRPDDSLFIGDEAYSFVHLLVRDAAYAGMLKRSRALLHEGFADWLLERAGDRLPEYEEIAGYHLEQAYRYIAELGTIDGREASIAGRAAALLASSGQRALGRGDLRAAIHLLSRADPLLSPDDPSRTRLLLDLGVALTEFGDFDRAEVLYIEMVDRARTQGDLGTELHARLAQTKLRMLSDPEGASERGLRLGKEAADAFAQLGDESGLAESYDLIGHSSLQQLMVGPAEAAWERAVLHATAAGRWRERSMCFSWLALAARFGPTPVDEAVERCEKIFEQSTDDRTIQAFVLDARAALEAMRGRFDEARAMVAQARALYGDLGLNVMGANLAQSSGYVEMLAGDAIAAEQEFRRGYVALKEMDEKGFLSTVAAQLAKALCVQGLLQEAQRFTEISEEAASRDDVQTQVLWRTARGLTLARLGRLSEAVTTCREAAQLAERTDNLDLRGEALMDLAQVLLLANEREEAVPVVEEAHASFAQKGDLVSAGSARQLIEQLSPRP